MKILSFLLFLFLLGCTAKSDLNTYVEELTLYGLPQYVEGRSDTIAWINEIDLQAAKKVHAVERKCNIVLTIFTDTTLRIIDVPGVLIFNDDDYFLMEPEVFYLKRTWFYPKRISLPEYYFINPNDPLEYE